MAKAKEAIKRHYWFHIPGLNFTNPVTFEDTGHLACFAATRDIEAGEQLTTDDFYPRLNTDGPYRNVNRLPNDSDIAVLGWK